MKVLGFEIKRAVPYVDATKGFLGTFFGNQVGRTAVTEKSVMGLSAYWAGVRRISESIALLPIDVVRKNGPQRIQIDHPTEFLLNKEANYKATAFDFVQILVTSAINHGNGIAIIERDNYSNPISLTNVPCSVITPKIYDDELYWVLQLKDQKTIQFKDEDILNLRGFGTDEILGLSAIKAHAQNLGLSLAAQDYGVDFYNKGTRIDGYIEYEGRLDPETKKRIKEAWNENYGPNGAGGTAILDNGSKYQRLGMPPEDAQFIETRKFQKNEVATILGIPPHIINDLEHATFSNIEHQGIEFVTYGLGSWIEKLEQEYARKLLREVEKKNTYFKHNVNRLLRTDVKAKAEHYRLMSDIGVYSINDIRALEDLNPVENGDERLVQLNRIPLEQISKYYARENNKSPDRT